MSDSSNPQLPAIYLARQPIFDSQMKLHAYELLFRSDEKNQATFIDGEAATAEVLTSAIIDIGLEKIVGARPAYINMTYQFLTGNILTPHLKDRLVLEILEDVVPDDALIDRLNELYNDGYTLALDDFIYKPELEFMLELAQIVKFDVMHLGTARLEEQVNKVRPFNVKLLAEKVETKDEFEFCKAIGFDYYQGYFFCKPEVVKGKRLSGNRMLMLNLMSKLQDPEIELDELDILIAQDASLAYKLLRHINSAFFGVDKNISSIKHAIAMAGIDTIKQWTTLSLMSKLGENKTSEILLLALVRANMCQILAGTQTTYAPDEYFTVGLFSVLDALLDKPMDEILTTLPLAQDVKDALIDYLGPLGTLLRLVIHYEKGVDISNTTDSSSLANAYLEAVEQAESLRSALD
ncbi:MAG: HDOD domain-containing protein [Pseudomonadales bacterium]|nr:HDOD domain-containing protein [Pseudomonadales bacterium]